MWINFAQFYIFQNINEFIHRFGTFRHNRPITLSHKQKSPHLRGPLIEILVFSVVAGEGFEPPTFGL